ncbi:tyrosine-type recombinase/integrase [Aliarcobacter butzleri]
MELHINPTLTIHFIEDENDDPETIEKLKQKIKKATADEIVKGNVKTLNIDDSKSISIGEAISKFLQYKKNVEKVKPATLSNYKSTFNYLYLFVDEETNIKILNKRFFNELQDKFMKIPKDYLKTKNRKNIDEVLEIDDKSTKLDAGTINKHFMVYKSLYDFLVRNDYIQKNSVDIKYLKEEDISHKEEFEYTELEEIFNYVSPQKTKDTDNESQNFCKFAYLTGMRMGEILNLKFEDIEIIGNHKIIDIKEGKTKTSVRLIPINKDLENILEEQQTKTKNGWIFYDYESEKDRLSPKGNPIGKRINRRINNYLTSKGKDTTLKSFHSFRKNFSQTLILERFNIKEQTISKLMGHSVSDNITRKFYIRNKVERDALIYAMSCIKISDVSTLKNENLYITKKENTINNIRKYDYDLSL